MTALGKESDKQNALKIIFIIVVIAIGGAIGFIWLFDFLLGVLHLPAWIVGIIIAVYSFGLIGLTLLIILGPLGKKGNLRNIQLDHISTTIGFLDMLCHGIIEMGTVNLQDSSWDLPDYDSIRARNYAGSTLFTLDKKMYEKWAKAVRSRVPKWTRLGVIKANISPMGSEMEACFGILILIASGGLTFYQAFGITGIIVTAILAVTGISSYYVYRNYRKGKTDKPLQSDAFQQESCQALQMVLDAANKQCASKFRVFVIGKHDELSYTGKTIETSNGHILYQAFLEPQSG